MERTGSDLLLTAFNICLLDMKAVGQKEDKGLKFVWIELQRSTKEINIIQSYTVLENCQDTPPT